MLDLLRAIRGDYRGHLRADGTVLRVAFVIDPGPGELVLAVAPAVAGAAELVLFCPDESGSSAQLLLAARVVEARGDAGTDRYMAYHGGATGAVFVRARVEVGRLGGEVHDEPGLRTRLHAEESGILRRLNADADVRARLSAQIGSPPPPGIVVGIDEHGVDVRGRFGPGRVWFPRAAADAAEAERLAGECR